jgi:DNA-binding response OmpR family regulator
MELVTGDGNWERGAASARRTRDVVVVEDDPLMADLLGDLLADEGYTVTVLPSAFGAREAVQRRRPSAVVLDLGLPYRSGAALLADLKADPAIAAIPVVVVSALTEALPPDRSALAAAVIGKPFPLRALLDALCAAGARLQPAESASRT